MAWAVRPPFIYNGMNYAQIPQQSILLCSDGSMKRMSISVDLETVIEDRELLSQLAGDVYNYVRLERCTRMVSKGSDYWIINSIPGFWYENRMAPVTYAELLEVVKSTDPGFNVRVWWKKPDGSSLFLITRCRLTEGLFRIDHMSDGEMHILLTDGSGDGIAYVPPLTNIFNDGKVCTGIKGAERSTFKSTRLLELNKMLLDRFNGSPGNSDLISRRNSWLRFFRATPNGIEHLSADYASEPRKWWYGLDSVSNEFTANVLFKS